VQANASSILDALTGLRKRNNFTLVYPNYTVFTDEVRIDAERNTYLNELKNIRKNMTARNTLIIGVIGEAPYAETLGDRNIPYCLNIDGNQEGCLYNPSINAYATSSQEKNLNVEYASFDMEVINSVRSVDSKIPLVTVMFSGRPMIVDAAMNISNAFISAWLPGTSGGQGVVDAISGDYLIRPNGKADRTNTLSMDWPANMVMQLLCRIH
jgi:beta-glucosidase